MARWIRDASGICGRRCGAARAGNRRLRVGRPRGGVLGRERRRDAATRVGSRSKRSSAQAALPATAHPRARARARAVRYTRTHAVDRRARRVVRAQCCDHRRRRRVRSAPIACAACTDVRARRDRSRRARDAAGQAALHDDLRRTARVCAARLLRGPGSSTAHTPASGVDVHSGVHRRRADDQHAARDQVGRPRLDRRAHPDALRRQRPRTTDALSSHVELVRSPHVANARDGRAARTAAHLQEGTTRLDPHPHLRTVVRPVDATAVPRRGSRQLRLRRSGRRLYGAVSPRQTPVQRRNSEFSIPN